MLPQSNLITKQLGKKVGDETKGDNCASNQKKETQAEIPSVINPWSSITEEEKISVGINWPTLAGSGDLFKHLLQ